tara:strand:- start:903 stop:1142 length:240 start_codon:yes stop_codon:yes gene_type:complete
MNWNRSSQTHSTTSKGYKSKRFKRRGQWPPLKIQFEEGQRAFYNGKLKNPYNQNNIRHKEWERGFNSAYFNNKKRRERR